jgi:hypothetical protein
MRDLPPRPEVLEMLTMILEARNERDWRHQAACKGMDPNIFFPTRGGNHTLRAAKAVCASCPVSTQCAEAGKDERTGTWGGISSFKRRRSNVPQKSFARQYKEWIIKTEPSDEVAAYDLGIQVGSVQRSRLRTQQAKEGTT